VSPLNRTAANNTASRCTRSILGNTNLRKKKLFSNEQLKVFIKNSSTQVMARDDDDNDDDDDDDDDNNNNT
jgi:hypothetical protein